MVTDQRICLTLKRPFEAIRSRLVRQCEHAGIQDQHMDGPDAVTYVNVTTKRADFSYLQLQQLELAHKFSDCSKRGEIHVHRRDISLVLCEQSAAIGANACRSRSQRLTLSSLRREICW